MAALDTDFVSCSEEWPDLFDFDAWSDYGSVDVVDLPSDVVLEESSGYSPSRAILESSLFQGVTTRLPQPRSALTAMSAPGSSHRVNADVAWSTFDTLCLGQDFDLDQSRYSKPNLDSFASTQIPCIPVSPSEGSRSDHDRRRTCRVCNESFSSLDSLEHHAKTARHRIYLCPECPRSYTRRDVYVRHKREHQVCSHICTFCARIGKHRAFGRKDHLQRHVQNCHSKEPGQADGFWTWMEPKAEALISRSTSPASSVYDKRTFADFSENDSGAEWPQSKPSSVFIWPRTEQATPPGCNAMEDILNAVLNMARDDRPAFQNFRRRLDMRTVATIEQHARNLAPVELERPDEHRDDITASPYDLERRAFSQPSTFRAERCWNGRGFCSK